MSEMLEKARNYETEKQVYVKKTTKPLFHVTAPTGSVSYTHLTLPTKA